MAADAAATTTTSLAHHRLDPLVFSSDSIPRRCQLCCRNISANAHAYTCRDCNSYFHKVCMEAPIQIDRHPLHPDHPLTFLHRPQPFKCYACCEVFCFDSSSFRCNDCDFDLNISCALSTISDQGCFNVGTSPEQIALPFHPHPLTSFSTRHDFVGGSDCAICLEHVEGDGYMCLRHWCKFLIHKRCIQDLYYADGAKAPRVYHEHPLETFVGEDKGLSRCGNCDSEDTSGEFICCGSCQVFYHRDCVQVPEILQYPHHQDHSLVLLINSTFDLIRRCQSCSIFLDVELCYGCPSCRFFTHVECALQTRAYCEKGMSAKIKWTWHEHPLLLRHRTKSVCGDCFYCGDKSTGPTYACEEQDCRFLLHQRCVEIEPTISNRHHPEHLLTLHTKADSPRPLCKACCGEIIDFNFSCELCAFYLHVKCAASVPTRKHYLHEHELLRLDEVPSLDCNRCGSSTDSPFFRCVACNFNLHEACMELPQIVKSKIHWHPLTLHEIFLEDDTGEYYCEHCEQRRDGRLGVYVCGECKISLPRIYHIECVLPELQKVYKNVRNTVIDRLAKEIARKEEDADATEKRLEKIKQELDELRKTHAELVLEEEKNYTSAR